ncbi:MAG: copper resistance protein CopC [Solirubrobacteraceae bacterium]
MRRILLIAVVWLGALCAGPGAAPAHPLLTQAAPTPGLVSPSAPAAVQLQFSEPTVSKGTSVELFGKDGERIATQPLAAGDGGRTLTLRPQQELAAAVYRVRWRALGADGHGVGGTFAFAVAGPNGPPPGAERLLGEAGAGGSGSQAADADGPVTVIVRWAGLLAASLLAGGYALLLVLRRRLAPEAARDAGRRWQRAARLALPIAVVTAIAGAATTEALTASPTGRAALIRLGVAVLLAASYLVRRRDRVLAFGGLALLATYALSGHVLSDGRPLALLDQLVHVLSAGVWLGGVVTLALVVARSAIPAGTAARAFAPLAATTLGLAALTGVLAAVREVDRWYFLRWSDYGRVVIIKTIVVAVAAGAGLVTTLRGRSASRRVLFAEGGLVAVVLALAASLAGLAQGRGQPTPAERGTLLPGPALATVLSPQGPSQLTIAPARPGTNVVSVSLPAAQTGARSVLLKLACPCSDRPLYVPLQRPQRGGTWTGRAELPASGSWYGSLTVDNKTAPSPVPLAIGVPEAPGASAVEVLAVADLTGPGAQRCADHVLGLTLGIGRINAAGGLDGGRKVAPLVLDSGGSAERAEAITRQAIADDRPIALAAPCGSDARGAVAAASAAGLPSIVADPAIGPVRAERDFRLAGDPYAEGWALGQYLRRTVVKTAAAGVDNAIAVDAGDEQSARRLHGLRESLAGASVRLRVLPSSAIENGSAARLRDLIDRRHTMALLLDGESPAALERALRRLGRGHPGFPPATILASARLMSERFVERSGGIGRLGAIHGTIEVSPDSRDALGYARGVSGLYPGRRPSLDGLRGYLAGLALGQAVAKGTDATSIAADLVRPAPFTDALSSPWRSDAPSAGSQRFTMLGASFLPPSLIPASAGGMTYNGTFLRDGAWTKLSTDVYGPPLDAPLPAL